LCLPDGGQGFVRSFLVVLGPVQRGRRLHVDQRDVVGQHVVELLGDPQPLLAGAPALLVGPVPRRLG